MGPRSTPVGTTATRAARDVDLHPGGLYDVKPLISEKNASRLFVAGIVLKGIDGVLESLGGATLLFVNPSEINRLFALLTQHELSEDPHDFIATHAVDLLARITPGSLSFGAAYLIAHGAVKIFLVLNLLRRRLWAYPATIVFLSIFVTYQIYRYSHSRSIGLLILSALDTAVMLLIWNEYRYLKAGPRGRAG